MNNNNKALIEVLKEKYGYENERKRYYDNVINLPISLLAFIITGIYFIVTENSGNSLFSIIRPFIIFPLLFCSIVSMFHLFRVFFKRTRKYSSFPSSETVFGDYEKLLRWHSETGQQSTTQNTFEQDFNDFIIQWYRDCNKNNTMVNDERAADFHSSKMFIGLSYIFGILIFIMFCAVKITSVKEPEKPIKVEILGQKDTIPPQTPAKSE